MNCPMRRTTWFDFRQSVGRVRIVAANKIACLRFSVMGTPQLVLVRVEVGNEILTLFGLGDSGPEVEDSPGSVSAEV